tara:strand:+ start:7556 stop:8602 length:1047 start_codon:yes stop_codon:yes gene_type:complete
MLVDSVTLGKYKIGNSLPCFFVAEIGGLFTDFNEAKRLIDSAIEIGVNAIKFQTLQAKTITTKENFFDLGVTGHVSQYDFFKKFEPSIEVQKKIVEYANECGIIVFSAPSHIEDLKLMEEMNLPIYKIGSDLACHIPLLKKIASLNKPIILSTGMTTIPEIRDSVEAIFETGNKQVILLHCVADYPCKIEEVNLKAIETMKKEFDLPVGYSDHTIGTSTSFASAVMGANMIEKHFKHPENEAYADDIHALNPEQFSELINSVRNFEKSVGTGEKIPTVSELENMKNNRVSIVSLKNIIKGEIITEDMIDVRRPGTGLAPKYFESIVGLRALKDIPKESPITKDMISGI